MNRIHSYFILLLAVGILGAVSAHADMTLTGSVVDILTERPIAGARVCIMGETRGVVQHAIMTTDDTGAFAGQLTGALDNVRVGISAARYQPVLLAVTSAVVQARLLRARTYAVRGIVTDASNTPVRNAQVALIAEDEEWRATCRAGDVWTDAAGTFESAHVPVNAGPLSLRVQAPGFVSAGGTALRVNPEDGDAFLTVRLSRGCRVVGHVRWDDGGEITNARVWVRAVKPEEVEKDSELLAAAPFEPIDGCIVYTECDGSFELDNLPPGVRCTAHADAPGAMPDLQGPFSVVDVHAIRVVNLRLARGAAWLMLTLTNAANARITNALVQMSKKIDEHSGQSVTMPYQVLPDQQLLFGPMPAARMESLHIRAPGYAVCYDRLALTPGATSQMTMALLPVPTRFVRVYDADTQREIPTVTFSAPQPVSTNHDGIACMPLPNSCSVRVSAPGYAPASSYLNSEEPLLTNIIWLARPFDLTVYVYNADGTPATAGTVDIYCATPNADYRDNARRFSGTISVGAGGTASFHNVPCYFSNATVCVRNVNWVPLASLSVKNIRAQTHRDVAITNPPLCRFAVTVNPDAANPMRTLECVGSNHEGDGLRQYELRQIMQSKTNSVWHADLFPTGTYAFAMLFDNDVRLRTNVTVTSATRSIQLFPRPGDLVSLRIILRPATTNVALQAVTVVVMNPREYFVARYRTGEFVCVGLEPGACYYVNVDLVTTVLVLSNVTPRSGPLYVNLPPLYTLRGTVACPDRAPARIRVVCSRKPFEYPAGRFAVPAIPPGTFPVTIGVAGHSATTFPVTITDQDVELGTIRLNATGAAVVTGRILGGNADTHRRIYWYNGLDYRDSSFTVADDGRFRTLPITRGSLVALSLISASGRTKIADVLLTNDVIDIGDVQVE